MKTTRVQKLFSAVMILAFSATSQLISGNELSVVRISGNQFAIELTNEDPVSGIQFSINARGSLKLTEIRSGTRAAEGLWEIHSYLKNDTTLNVVMLAPYRSALSAGSGALVVVSYASDPHKSANLEVFLSRTEIVNPQSQILQLTVNSLTWSAQESAQGSSFFTLGENYPNPFNPSTTISYELRTVAQVKLLIYDITGRQIATLVNHSQFPGHYEVKWEGNDDAGQKVSSGMYIARLQVENEVASKKMILTK